MSRIHHIPTIEIAQKEKPQLSVFNAYPTNCALRRNNQSFLQRIRSNTTQSFILGSCNSMRDFCSNIQSITSEVNSLLSSIENIMPLINTYLSGMQSREKEREALPLASAEPNAASFTSPKNHYGAKNPALSANTIPKAEDLQQLLENPLVKNLLNSFVQNSTANKG